MRVAALLLLGVLLLLVQCNLYLLMGGLGLHGATPNLLLPVIIFVGVHEPSMARGASIAFALGHALDLFACAPMWLFTFIFVAIWWLARIAGVRLTAQTALTRMSLAFAFTLVEAAITLILLAVFGADTQRPLELATIVPLRATSTALCSPIVFRLVQRLYPPSTPVRAATEAAST
jgi:rod shape-determining protein MreD